MSRPALLAVVLLASGCWVTDAELAEWALDTGPGLGADGDPADGNGTVSIRAAVGVDLDDTHGLTMHNGELWAGDWTTSMLYTLDPSTGSATARVDLLGENPLDLASDGTELWVLTTSGGLLRVDTGIGTFVAYTASADRWGLASDGSALFVGTGASLERVRTDSVETQYGLEYAGEATAPIVADTTTLVHADGSGGGLALVAYDLTGALSAPKVAEVTVSGLEATGTTGVALHDDTAYVAGPGGLSSTTLTSLDLSQAPW